MDADVIIAGAGPAGVAAAVAVAMRRPDLAERGRIVCFDKARFPRDKPCGGGLTGHARRALDELGLAVRVPRIACRSGRIVYGGEAPQVALDQPVDVVRRADFDADLVAQARARGVTIVEGEAVVAYAVDAARRVVAVTTAAGRRLDARVLVAADGAGSRIRHAVINSGSARARNGDGDGDGDGDGAGGAAAGAGRRARRSPRPLRLFMREVPAPRPFPAEMVYDFSAMDRGLRGYVWLFPVPGHRLNVGAMHYPSRPLGGAAVVRVLEETLGRHGVRLPAPPRGWPAWPYAARARLGAPHVLLVGDAAGIDALTGEGIAVGLEHGPLAGAEIVEALAGGDFSFRRYAARVRAAEVGRELALDGRLAAMLYRPRHFRLWLSLVMCDPRMRALYAARVSGSQVLADRPGALLAALGRHVLLAPHRLRRLARASSAITAAA